MSHEEYLKIRARLSEFFAKLEDDYPWADVRLSASHIQILDRRRAKAKKLDSDWQKPESRDHIRVIALGYDEVNG